MGESREERRLRVRVSGAVIVGGGGSYVGGWGGVGGLRARRGGGSFPSGRKCKCDCEATICCLRRE